jgi:superfamily II DNA or RNA helicase
VLLALKTEPGLQSSQTFKLRDFPEKKSRSFFMTVEAFQRMAQNNCLAHEPLSLRLKPLIKTHWLSSQNPMEISLGGISCVIFTPPESTLNFQFGESDPKKNDERIWLPPAADTIRLPAEEAEIRAVESQAGAFSRDLFWTLFSGNPSDRLREPVEALKKIAHSLEVQTTDGKIYSLVGLFRRGTLPLFLNPKFYLQDHSVNWEKALSHPTSEFMNPLRVFSYQKRDEGFKRAWVLVLEMLAWSFQRRKEVGDLEVLYADGTSTADGRRVAYKLEDVHFTPPLPLAATVSSAPEKKDTVRITYFQGAELFSSNGVLCLPGVGRLGELENEFSSGVSALPVELAALEKHLVDTTLDWKPKYVREESGAKHIVQVLTKLDVLLGSERVFFVNHSLVQGESFQPRLDLKEVDGRMLMQVSFSLPQSDEDSGNTYPSLKHLNFPDSAQPFFMPFFGGMDTFFKVDRKALASKQVQFRNADLSFLRHQGVTLFCLLEMLNWRLQRPLSSGEVIEFSEDLDSPAAHRQFDRFLKYLKESIPGLFGKPGQPFEKIFSNEVRTFFQDYIEKQVENLVDDRTLLFVGDQIIEIRNTAFQVLPLIRLLVLYLVEESEGKLLARAQSAGGEQFRAALEKWTDGALVPESDPAGPTSVDIGLYHRYLVPLLFELSDVGFAVSLNGTPLVSQENPFQFGFSIGEDTVGRVSATGKTEGNWFDLHPQIFFNGTRVASEEVKLNFTPDQVGFIEYRGHMYRVDKKELPTLKALQRFWRRIIGLNKGAGKDRFGEKIYRLNRSKALELLMLKAEGITVEAHGEWKKIFDYFDQGLGNNKVPLTPEGEQKLLPHQRAGVQWLHDLYELRLGAILADEMGLGKTFQILSFLESLQAREKLGKSLIIVPTSLVYNWMDEKKKFAPNLPVQVFQVSERKALAEALSKPDPLVVVTTYGLLNEHLNYFKDYDWNVVVFDEAQSLKNLNSQRSVSGRKLKAEFKVCLTGTPMENHYLEFYALCDLVVPGSLGEVRTFRKTYFNQEVPAELLRELRLITKPLLLRRTKKQVNLSLPSKTVQKVLLPFTELQKDIYKKMAMRFSRQVETLIETDGEQKAQIAMFSALMRLRQICSDPAAVPGVDYPERPVKVEHFMKSLEDHLENEESVIVFTQFLSTLGRLRKELERAGVPVFTLQGNVPAKERLNLISAFQESKQPGVMLMTLKTGGVGLNLTKASVVYHLEPWWNPAVENQATDRAHRMGQTKDVKVYNLLIEGSLEERITDLKLKKQGSFDRLFGTNERSDEVGDESTFEGSHSLSRADFFYLLK